MKNILMIIFITLFSLSALSVGPAPEYMKGGTITVTLKDGKTYTYSTDEYAVVKRGPKSVESEKPAAVALEKAPEQSVQAAHQNILSLGLVRSKRGLRVSETASTVEVENKKEIGVSVQYQRLISDDLYLGGQIDTNQGVGINLGVGF